MTIMTIFRLVARLLSYGRTHNNVSINGYTFYGGTGNSYWIGTDKHKGGYR